MKKLILAVLLLTSTSAFAEKFCTQAYKDTKTIIEYRMSGVSEVKAYEEAVQKKNVMAKRIIVRVYAAKPDELKDLPQVIFISCLKAFGEDV